MEAVFDILTYSEARPLLFTQYRFWGLFTVLMLFYGLLYRKQKLRILYLLAFSFFFYYKSSGFFFVLLIVSTLVDFSLGNLIYRSAKEAARKFYVALSVTANLGLLGYFKYAYFFTESMNSLLGLEWRTHNFLSAAANQWLAADFDEWSIILPVGISFYTFQTISYTVDVYRGRVRPVRDIFDFAFYVSFFPQLVAGPIVRAADFVPQIYRKYKLEMRELNTAIFLILNGLIKKMVISDYISVNFVDRVFEDPAAYSGFENLMAIYGYAVQIYCDFSGYTDIAIGLALLLGFRLPLNFDSPYKAINITDFWRRWHISLSSWLKDYLYIPLGGNRKGKVRTYINLLITMLLGGLWHGAAGKFILWGAIHGVGLALHKLWLQLWPSSGKTAGWQRLFYGIFTFHFVCLAWVYFRAPSTASGNQMLQRIAITFQPELVADMAWSYRNVFSLILVAMAIHLLPVSWKEGYKQGFMRTPIWLKAIITALVVLVLYQFQTADVQPFIYFQF
ncbi:MAG: MBOAT family protein [Bacteroidota bacterium]